jgi:hypothetical protein
VAQAYTTLMCRNFVSIKHIHFCLACVFHEPHCQQRLFFSIILLHSFRKQPHSTLCLNVRLQLLPFYNKLSFSMCMNNVIGIWFIHWTYFGWLIRNDPSNTNNVNPHYRLFLSYMPKQQGEWGVLNGKRQFLHVSCNTTRPVRFIRNAAKMYHRSSCWQNTDKTYCMCNFSG